MFNLFNIKKINGHQYCCESFRFRALLPRNKGPNIRILKISQDLLLDKEKVYRCFIAPAYEAGARGIAVMPIAFCPFCGKNLFEYINSDDYVNEEDNEFMHS